MGTMRLWLVCLVFGFPHSVISMACFKGRRSDFESTSYERHRAVNCLNERENSQSV